MRIGKTVHRSLLRVTRFYSTSKEEQEKLCRYALNKASIDSTFPSEMKQQGMYLFRLVRQKVEILPKFKSDPKQKTCYLSKDAIISELINGGQVEQACQRITAGHELKDDLFQEVFVVLMGYPEIKLQELHGRKQLMFFIVGIMMTMWRSPRSDFNRAYRQRKAEFDVSAIIVHDDYNEALDVAIEEVKKEISSMSQTSSGWYKARLLELETEIGSHQKIAAMTGISKSSISRAIREAKGHIKAKVKLKDE